MKKRLLKWLNENAPKDGQFAGFAPFLTMALMQMSEADVEGMIRDMRAMLDGLQSSEHHPF